MNNSKAYRVGNAMYVQLRPKSLPTFKTTYKFDPFLASLSNMYALNNGSIWIEVRLLKGIGAIELINDMLEL